jgi:hypothetical protein
LLLGFVGLLVLTRWITKHVQGIGYLLSGDGQIALVLYFLLILPGVVLHELSHALTALILGVRVRRFSIGIRRKGKSQQFALGSVEIASTDPFRASLIGVAPLVTGCATILWISSSILRLEMLPAFAGPGFWNTLLSIYETPDFWIWAYLVLAIGNSMLPSAADRGSWKTTLVFAAFVGTALYFSGLLTKISATLSSWARASAAQLAYAFIVTVIVDLVFGIALVTVEQILALIGLGRVQYH